jgi:hypothetical protein
MMVAAPKNANYAAQIIRIPAVRTLDGLDNLVGVPVFGELALTQKAEAEVGQLRVAFTAETQLSDDMAAYSNLYRHTDKNVDPTAAAGYLDDNRRVRAQKFRGHVSSALLLPLSSLEWTGYDVSTLEVGDTFDVLDGKEICRKFERPVKGGTAAASKLKRAFRHIEEKTFPEHLATDNLAKSASRFQTPKHSIITQKLHGTSLRAGYVQVLRDKGRLERFLNRWFPTADHTYGLVAGSRKVIKSVDGKAESAAQDHFYADDIWTKYTLELFPPGSLPPNVMVYGELVGWTPDGAPIQKGYTYDVPKGKAELYVYRVATVTVSNGVVFMADLSWDGVLQFCADRGLKHVPEFVRVPLAADYIESEGFAREWLDKRFWSLQQDSETVYGDLFRDQAVPLSDKKLPDEGVVVRVEGVVPELYKLKSPGFLVHETKDLDSEVVDLESAESA